jgi:predicted small secreted protein
MWLTLISLFTKGMEPQRLFCRMLAGCNTVTLAGRRLREHGFCVTNQVGANVTHTFNHRRLFLRRVWPLWERLTASLSKLAPIALPWLRAARASELRERKVLQQSSSLDWEVLAHNEHTGLNLKRFTFRTC